MLSSGFIVGGLIVARRGLGANPLRTLLVVNVVMWAVSSVFTLRSWILLLAVGMFIWLCLVPFAEAAEQTVLQKVVPFERQGRVFGFAQSVEMAASPLTAFLISPIAQFVAIPFTTTGARRRADRRLVRHGPRTRPRAGVHHHRPPRAATHPRRVPHARLPAAFAPLPGGARDRLSGFLDPAESSSGRVDHRDRDVTRACGTSFSASRKAAECTGGRLGGSERCRCLSGI